MAAAEGRLLPAPSKHSLQVTNEPHLKEKVKKKKCAFGSSWYQTS